MRTSKRIDNQRKRKIVSLTSIKTSDELRTEETIVPKYYIQTQRNCVYYITILDKVLTNSLLCMTMVQNINMIAN